MFHVLMRHPVTIASPASYSLIRYILRNVSIFDTHVYNVVAVFDYHILYA